MRIDVTKLGNASVAVLALAMLMPASAWAQAATIPATDTPGTPAQVDPAPAQTAIVPNDATTAPIPPPPPSRRTPSPPRDGGEGADIIVTGFRKSLDAALSVKRQSVAAVDAIVAEGYRQVPRPESGRITSAHPRHLDPA